MLKKSFNNNSHKIFYTFPSNSFALAGLTFASVKEHYSKYTVTFKKVQQLCKLIQLKWATIESHKKKYGQPGFEKIKKLNSASHQGSTN